MYTPFELLYGMKPRLPSFPNQDTQRLHNGESFASQRLQILQKARAVAFENSQKQGETYRAQYDKRTTPHTYKICDLGFLSRNKKLAPNGWVRLRLSKLPKQTFRLNANRVK